MVSCRMSESGDTWSVWRCVVDYDVLSRIAHSLSYERLFDSDIVDLKNRLVWHMWRPGPRLSDSNGLGRLCFEDSVVQASLAHSLDGLLPIKEDETIAGCFGSDVAWLCETILFDGLCYPVCPPEAKAERLLHHSLLAPVKLA